MVTCICGKNLNKVDDKIIPCAHCLDDAIQKVLVNLNAIHSISKGQANILNERRVNLIKIMEAKPNVRKIEITK